MTIFDNMLELNNSFLLIALIIIAVICIYLLYSNLTKSGETASLKSGLTALIQQNKKRDEIINFLLERIENLEHTIVPSAAPVGTELQATGLTESEPKHDDIDDILSTINNSYIPSSAVKDVVDILGSIIISNAKDNAASENMGLMVQDVDTTATHVEPETQVPPTLNSNSTSGEVEFDVDAAAETVPAELHETEQQQLHTSTDPVIQNVSEYHDGPVSEAGEFHELESEFDGLMIEQNESTPTNNDLVSALLDADEESLAGDHEFDLTTVPKSKDKLNAQYTVKQLKALSRQLKLKSKGNKTELINRICEKLN